MPVGSVVFEISLVREPSKVATVVGELTLAMHQTGQKISDILHVSWQRWQRDVCHLADGDFLADGDRVPRGRQTAVISCSPSTKQTRTNLKAPKQIEEVRETAAMFNLRSPKHLLAL
jgi:hypothetical protein